MDAFIFLYWDRLKIFEFFWQLFWKIFKRWKFQKNYCKIFKRLKLTSNSWQIVHNRNLRQISIFFSLRKRRRFLTQFSSIFYFTSSHFFHFIKNFATDFHVYLLHSSAHNNYTLIRIHFYIPLLALHKKLKMYLE
jgi:hypothetical protein